MESSVVAPRCSLEIGGDQDVKSELVLGSKASAFNEEEQKQPSSEIEVVDDGNSKYMSGQKRILLSLSLSLVVFIIGTDGTIIATAVPTISSQFNSLEDVGWYGSAFYLTRCSFQLFWGKLYKICTTKTTFLIAIAIFELGSLLSAVAPSSSCFIIGRAISGVGCSGIVSGAILIIAETVPLHQRPMYMAVVGGMEALSTVTGPLIGGALTTHVSWRWCFYINLPVGVAAIAAVMAFYRPEKHNPTWRELKESLRDIDWLGMGIFIPAIFSLLLALQWGGQTYSWKNARIIVLLILAGVLILPFAYIQSRRQKSATLPPHIIKERSMAFGLSFAFCGASALSVVDFYLPLWFQAIKGVSAFQSAVMTLAVILALIVGTLISGVGVTKFGYYKPFMFVGCIVTSVGAGLMTTFKPYTPHPNWIGYQVILGLGSGMSFQQPLLIAQVVLDDEDLAIGTALVFLTQNLGSAIAISIAQAIFTNSLSKDLQGIPNVDPDIIQNAGATSLRTAVGADELPQVVSAYNKALVGVFYLAATFGALSVVGAIGVANRSVKEKKQKLEAEKAAAEKSPAIEKEAEVSGVDVLPAETSSR